MKDLLIPAGAAGLCAFLLTLLFGYIVLPVLRRKKAGQYINEFAPESHQAKAGTPTMGGISFVPAFLVAVAAAVVYWSAGGQTDALIPVALVVLYALGNTVIGFVDDYFKLNRRQNEGLTEAQKFLLQVVFAAAFIAMMRITGHLTTALHIPLLDVTWQLGWLAYPIYLVVLVGFVNATNITDGLDGLAASVCATVAAFVVLFAALRGERELAVLGAALFGCMPGFLAYNRHPAKMFMGDTGSLFLGGVLMGCAVMAGELLLFVLAGFMFVIEMLSSLLQRLCFKLTARLTGTGRRIFRMAPLHHHFEKCGWREVGIVALFSLVSLGFCVLAWLGM